MIKMLLKYFRRFYYDKWFWRWKYKDGSLHVQNAADVDLPLPIRQTLNAYRKIHNQRVFADHFGDVLLAVQKINAFSWSSSERLAEENYWRFENIFLSIRLRLRLTFFLDWEVQFDQSRELSFYGISKMENCMEFVVDFFKFYKSFDFDSDAVVPYLGRKVAKCDYFRHPSLRQ